MPNWFCHHSLLTSSTSSFHRAATVCPVLAPWRSQLLLQHQGELPGSNFFQQMLDMNWGPVSLCFQYNFSRIHIEHLNSQPSGLKTNTSPFCDFLPGMLPALLNWWGPVGCTRFFWPSVPPELLDWKGTELDWALECPDLSDSACEASGSDSMGPRCCGMLFRA